jgi:hypothetical protein
MTWGVIGGAVKPKVWVVECKRCRRHIPAGVESFPPDNIRVDCPLCDERRRYRPSEVYLGWVDIALLKQQVQRAEQSRIARQKERA